MRRKAFLPILTSILCWQIPFNSDAVTPEPNCTTVECHSRIKTGKSVHGPVKADGCTICHVVKGGEKRGKHVDLEPIGLSKVNRKCLSCHEEMGFHLKKASSVHTVIGNKTCLSCHDPHNSSNNNLLIRGNNTETCLSCHSGILKAQKNLHGALKTKDSCLNCHDSHFSKNHKALLKSRVDNLCKNCHNRELVNRKGEKVSDVFSEAKHFKSVHKPFKDGECTKCHDPHGGQHSHHLTSFFEEQGYLSEYNSKNYSLCFRCHSKKSIELTKTTKTGFRNGLQNLHFVHVKGLKKKRSCRLCHGAHGGQFEKLMGSGFSFSGYEVASKYQKSKFGGNCTTLCHGNKSYDRRSVKK